MLYFLLKLIFRTALKVFYKRIAINQAHLIPDKGPLLVVSNHPNTFMDPIIIASVLKQKVYFIAKSTVFNTPFRKWLLNKMNLIPVYRREDGEVMRGSNDATFQKCYEFLGAQGTLLIFPEGNSFTERRLRPLKTGSARIAFGAAAQTDFEQDVYILPVGLNYSESTRFRSEVLVNIDAPISVKTYADLYRQDSAKAFHVLTNHIRTVLERLVIHTATNDDDKLVQQIETIYKSRLLAESGVQKPRPTDEFYLTRRLVKSLHYFKAREPERVARIRQQMDIYIGTLSQFQLKDKFFYNRAGNRRLSSWLVLSGLYLLLGLPVYLYGLLTNYVPYILPAKVADALTEEKEFVAPILMTAGIFTFAFFYALEIYLVYYFTKAPGLTIIFAFSLPMAGFFVWGYYRKLTHTIANLKLLALFFNKNSLVWDLMQQRHAIINDLELAKQQYLRDVQADTKPTE